MKKGRLFCSLIVLVFFVNFILAATNTSVNNSADADIASVNDSFTSDRQTKIDLAYKCLNDAIDKKTCATLSLEEKIFSVISTGKCLNELNTASDNNKCWPKASCDIKKTAQSILALERTSGNINSSLSWLLTKNGTASELEWYLQIEGDKEMNCKITYDKNTYAVKINKDRTVSSGAGSCLTPGYSNYWLKISKACQSKSFDVSCSESFQTNLLYKKQDSQTVYVSDKTNSASAEGATTESIFSQCFLVQGVCNYEATLWATFVLASLEKDVTPFLPYLTVYAEDNLELLPESFLYYITNSLDYKTNLLLKQKTSFWDESGDKFYDTAIALLPLYYEEPQEKEKAINWLLEPGVQDKEGCWKGNLRNTAFLLYAISQKDIGGSGKVEDDCESSGYFCMSPMACKGSVLDGFGCSGVSKCCDTKITLQNCSTQGGIVCPSSKECVGGTVLDASGIGFGESCCVQGSCQIPEQESECETNYGFCKSACSATEEESTDACNLASQVCCVKATPPTKSSSWWIWILILLILIVLVAIGIVKRNELKPFFAQITSKFNKGSPSAPNAVGPSSRLPERMPNTQMRPVVPGQQRVMPPRQMPRPSAPQGKPFAPSRELEETLKKLKEMGK